MPLYFGVPSKLHVKEKGSTLLQKTQIKTLFESSFRSESRSQSMAGQANQLKGSGDKKLAGDDLGILIGKQTELLLTNEEVVI